MAESAEYRMATGASSRPQAAGAERAAGSPFFRTAARLGGKLYSLGLFALLVIYYEFLIVGLAQLVNASLWLNSRFSPGTSRTLWLGAMLIIVFLAIRFVGELWWGIVGLVTERFDDDHHGDTSLCSLRDDDAPQLFALITELAKRVKAPFPDEVKICPRAECYVVESRRLHWGGHRKLTLVLGLPHLSVLSAAELKVIISHELAHLRNGDTRLGVFLHRFLELLRAANEWQLNQMSAWIDPLFYFRWLYFQLCFALAAPIVRRQELLADRTSASLFGGEFTARTLLREWLVAQQFDAVLEERQLHSDRAEAAASGVVVFHEFARRFNGFSPAAFNYLQQRLALTEQSFRSDSHPVMRDRLAAVSGYPACECIDERSAAELIPDLASWQQRIHRQFVLN